MLNRQTQRHPLFHIYIYTRFANGIQCKDEWYICRFEGWTGATQRDKFPCACGRSSYWFNVVITLQVSRKHETKKAQRGVLAMFSISHADRRQCVNESSFILEALKFTSHSCPSHRQKTLLKSGRILIGWLLECVRIVCKVLKNRDKRWGVPKQSVRQ